ncbi:MAG: DivIVA domain-containing protein [Christensenellaceae bacterium]|nr:DivIVA domain-containing protein [Christensenellaceae bacterium]
MNMSVEIIANKQFHQAPQGYDINEVNEFLDEICDYLDYLDEQKANNADAIDRSALEKRDAEIARLQQLLKDAQRESAEAKAKLALAPKSESAVNAERATQLLVNAQKVYDKTIADANKFAEELKVKAKAEADDAIGGLSEKKELLTKEIGELKASFDSYHQKFQNVLEEVKKHLDASKDKFK